MEADSTIVDDLDAFGFLFQDIPPGTAVVLKAEFDVLWRHWLTVVKFNAFPEPEGGTFGVFGKLVALCQCQMVVEVCPRIFNEGIVEGHEEIVRGSPPIVFLRVQPSAGNTYVPGQDHLALRDDLRCRGWSRWRWLRCDVRAAPQEEEQQSYNTQKTEHLVHAIVP